MFIEHIRNAIISMATYDEARYFGKGSVASSALNWFSDSTSLHFAHLFTFAILLALVFA